MSHMTNHTQTAKTLGVTTGHAYADLFAYSYSAPLIESFHIRRSYEYA